jgi:hypothetical protein
MSADAKKLSTGKKVAIGFAVAAVVAVVIMIVMRLSRSSSSAAPSPEPPKPVEPTKPVETIPLPPAEPNPLAPTTKPVQGQYYVPKAGDGEIAICTAAGLLNIPKAWKVMRDHVRNAWIPKCTRPGQTALQLDIDWGYAPMAGHGDKKWAWKTEHTTSGGQKVCLVYVPKQEEFGG